MTKIEILSKLLGLSLSQNSLGILQCECKHPEGYFYVMLLYIILPWKDEIEYIYFAFKTCVSKKMENVLSCKIIEHEQSFCVYLFFDFSQAEQKQPLH